MYLDIYFLCFFLRTCNKEDLIVIFKIFFSIDLLYFIYLLCYLLIN